MSKSEKWLPVVGWESLYEVSNQGKVRSLDRRVDFPDGRKSYMKKGREMFLWKAKSGHLTVRLNFEAKSKTFYVHRLVLEAFVGPCPEGMECLHGRNGVEDNSVSNLRWGTSSENNLDIKRDGNNQQLKKTHCPRGHKLSLPNLSSYPLKKKGHRTCLSCERARARFYKDPSLDVQKESDKYYSKIMGDSVAV